MSDDNEHAGLRDLAGDSDHVARYYDDWADDYDRSLAQWGYEAPGQVAARLRERSPTDAVVLDAGCGTGLSGAALADAGFTVVDGMDVSQRSLDIAQGLGVYRSLACVDMQRLPLPYADDAYDAITCVGVLTYIQDNAAIMREFCRVARPGAVLVVTQRSDLLAERDFAATMEALEREGLVRSQEISGPMPYLPYNEEFGDDIHVHYVTAVVA